MMIKCERETDVKIIEILKPTIVLFMLAYKRREQTLTNCFIDIQIFSEFLEGLKGV